ncbi:glucose-1-phosphate thymidylyltransferase [Streptomyces pimonensis]|uniref:Glucose-1-phosphate thymidylyltransferase n=1 Tax=Streptomyces pimonensis TaxID=2860288 RepID=A0ABV4J6K0_9ACTN
MKALVLSGGAGTRLRPFSYSMSKQLIPIANKPVLEHVLENIRELGVKDVGIIVGDRAAEISAVVGDGGRFGIRLTYIRQDRPRGLAHCVAIARDYLADDDFVMYLGDNMLPDGVRGVAEEFTARRPAAHLVVQRVPDARSFGVVETDTNGGVLRLVEKPSVPRSDLALVGVYFFTSAIHQAVTAIRPSSRGELEITDAVEWLVRQGAEVRATEYSGYWKDTGRVEDVLECNQQLLDKLKSSTAGDVDVGSELTGQVVVGPGARVVRSRIRGPVVIGAGTVVEDSQIGPYVSVGRDCVLRDSGLSHSIVLDGASVSQVSGLHLSVIGRSAIVRATGSGQHRLVVGDHTRVEVVA